MTDPMSDPRQTALKAALADLADGLEAVDGDDLGVARKARERLPDLRAAVDEAREAFDDPDPPEPEPPELLPDLATVEQAFHADDPAAWLDQRAADLGATAGDAEALRRVLRAGDRNEPVAQDLETAAGRELNRRERVALRAVRLALLDGGSREQWRDARDEMAAVHAMHVAVAMALLGLPEPSGLRPTTDWKDVSLPAPVLWRTPTPREADVPGLEPDRVASLGEVAVMASAGGIGKSTITYGLAAAAASAHCEAKRYADHCGLRVAAGPVAMVSIEESEPWIVRGLRWYAGDDALACIHVLPHAEPLWQAAAERGGQSAPTRQWIPLWRSIRAVGARLVVIDPVSAALIDVSTSEVGPVRRFIRALEGMAAPDPARNWAGCAVLLVAHDTKEHRADVRAGAAPNAGAIAGSAAWWDAPRGVLTVAHIPDGLRIECAKSNHGRDSWGADLAARFDDDGNFTGFKPKPVRVYTPEELEIRRAVELASRKEGKQWGGGDRERPRRRVREAGRPSSMTPAERKELEKL